MDGALDVERREAVDGGEADSTGSEAPVGERDNRETGDSLSGEVSGG